MILGELTKKNNRIAELEGIVCENKRIIEEAKHRIYLCQLEIAMVCDNEKKER